MRQKDAVNRSGIAECGGRRVLLHKLNNIRNIAVKRPAYAVKEIAVVADDFVFVIVVDYQECGARSLCKLIPCNTELIDIFVYSQPYHKYTPFLIYLYLYAF